MSTHIPHANQPGRTSSNSMKQQSHNIILCHTRLKPYDDDHQTTDNNFIDTPPPTITDTILPPPPQYRRWGLGTNLSSLRSHIHLTYRPAQSLANPAHRDWRTRARSTNTQQRSPPPMASLPTRIHASHGHYRSHAHPRKWNPPRRQHLLRTHQDFPYSSHELDY
ncbi:unnamed protein product [Schistocephalus solidus]|uniref:Uncharacterized protein n=1 Tax=Schistocephalus solidus TaxID=70667 RepID=A0A3P7CZI4_SCHSO|nr:unnamed protein product [Schistocephalus solidus]